MSYTASILLTLVIIAAVVVVVAWLFERSSREISLVRTGLGGRKVVLDGGIIVLPYFHKISRVNMQTLRLEVARVSEQALITKDRLRVDVGVEFYVSVEPTEDSIARASQTLGNRIFDREKLRELIEGKLVDALRSVAAQRTMDELHEGRGDFVKEVKGHLLEELRRNGLGIESVSLTALDQTPFSALDENNAFNAVGMRKLAEVIAKSKKDHASIDSEAQVAVRLSAMQASKLSLEIAQKLALETAEQQRVIAISTQSQEEAKAQAAAHSAHAHAAKAAAEVATVRAVAVAQRAQELGMINAEKDSQTDSLIKRREAETQVDVAEKHAKASVITAQAKAQVQGLSAKSLAQELAVQAQGQKSMNEAHNIQNKDIVNLARDKARLDALPGIIEQMVRPAQNIESIKIHHITGGALGRAAPVSASGEAGSSEGKSAGKSGVGFGDGYGDSVACPA